MKKIQVLSIDPSVNFVGWCLFNSAGKSLRDCYKWGTLLLEGHNYQMRLTLLVQLIEQEIIEKYGPFQILVAEWPIFFAGAKGMIAVRQNYTVDLAGVVQYVAGRFEMDHRSMFLFTPTQWKGSEPKDVTARRFIRAFKISLRGITDHAIDATMLMRHWVATVANLHQPTIFTRDRLRIFLGESSEQPVHNLI